MKKQTKRNAAKHRDPMALPNQAISAFHEGGDPLGQYTGTPEVGPCMPRKKVEGARHCKTDEAPVQDADDL